MEFRRMSIGSFKYGNMRSSEKKEENFSFQDDDFEQHMKQKSHPNYDRIQAFCTHLALCHTIMI